MINFQLVFRNYLDQHKLFKQFVKFCIVGGTSAAFNFLIYYSVTEWLGVWYVYSSIVAFLISAVFNFLADKNWTFRNTDIGWAMINQLSKFATVMISGLIINTAIIYFLTDWFGFDYRLSWVFATGIVTFWNFSFNRFWTFRHRQNLSLE